MHVVQVVPLFLVFAAICLPCYRIRISAGCFDRMSDDLKDVTVARCVGSQFSVSPSGQGKRITFTVERICVRNDAKMDVSLGHDECHIIIGFLFVVFSVGRLVISRFSGDKSTGRFRRKSTTLYCVRASSGGLRKKDLNNDENS